MAAAAAQQLPLEFPTGVDSFQNQDFAAKISPDDSFELRLGDEPAAYSLLEISPEHLTAGGNFRDLERGDFTAKNFKHG